MTVDSEHEFHPDAERLNAFAEEVMGARERGEIIAHLAECGRCRQIVFLAQEAASGIETEMVPQMAAVAAGSQSSFVPRRRRWYQSWRLAWMPVGALAALVTVSYVVHLQRNELNSDVAKVAPATASQNQATVAAPPAPQAVAPPPTVSVQAQIVAKKNKSSEFGSATPGSALKEKLSPVASPSFAANRQLDSFSDAAAMPPAAPAPPAQGGAARIAPLPTRAAAQVEQPPSEVTLQAERNAPMTMSRAKTSDAAQKQMAGSALAAAATPSKIDEKAGLHSSVLGAGRPINTGAFGVYKARPIALPSGLGAVSTVSANHRTIAIDVQGAVFESDEADGHWVAVAKQWSGRAVTVRLQSGGLSNLSVAAQSVSGFEMVNDQGHVWVSTDGRIWMAK